MTAVERRRRDSVAAMLHGNVKHAQQVAECVRAAIADGSRAADEGASMLRSIDAKIARWRREATR